MNEGKKLLGSLSALCTFGLLALIAWKAEVFGMVINELIMFISGGFREVASNHTTFLMMFPVILAVVVLNLSCAVGANVLQEKILGKSGKHMLVDFFEEMEEDNHFFTFFVIVLLEELFARWFFLGLLTKISFLSGTVAFYALFLIGNGIWALIHLSNFKEEKDRKVLRVLPQFVGGVFFTYVFVKYGLLAAILAHFASNAVIFAVHKVQRINVIDGLIVGYAALCAAISYTLMEKPLADVLPWFADSPVFRLQGWEFWDYVKISVFLSASFVIVFGLLLYDRGEAEKKKSDKDIGLVGYIVGIPIVISLLYGIYALLGLFIANVPYRVLVLAISDPFSARRTVKIARGLSPGLHIMVRTRYLREMEELHQLGADEVVPEEFETSIEIFTLVLRTYQMPQDFIIQKAEQVRREGYALLRRSALPQLAHHLRGGTLTDVEVETFRIEADSPALGKTLEQVSIWPRTGASMIAHTRRGVTASNPSEKVRLELGDVVVLLGTRDQIRRAIGLLADSKGG
jgi:hypothetical protein